MKESSNNTVTLLILAIALAGLFAVMHFTDIPSDIETEAYSGVKVSTSKSINLNAFGTDIYSDNLAGYKSRSVVATNGTSGLKIPGAIDAPSANIKQADVQTVPQRQVARTRASTATTFAQSQSKTFKTSNASSVAVDQSVPKSDINSTIKARTTEVAPVTTKKGKIATTDKKGPQKAGDKPANPGLGSLPIGDGTWLLMLMVGMYATRKNIKKLTPSMDKNQSPSMN